MEDENLIKFLTERDDRLLKNVTDLLDNRLKAMSSDVKNSMLEREQQIIKGMSDTNLVISNINNKIDTLSNKANILFVIADDLRDNQIPTIKVNTDKIETLEDDMKEVKGKQDNLINKLQNIKEKLQANKEQKRGMLTIWHIIFYIMCCLTFLKGLYDLFKIS